MVDVLKAGSLYAAALVALVAAFLTYRGTRGANKNVAAKTSLDKYQVLDAKQEQIAEWGFKAADDANKRADRIAAEAQEQVVHLQEQLNELRDKLKEQVAVMEEMRTLHMAELARARDTHGREIDERNRRIYALEDELKRQQGDRGRQTREGTRQTIEGERLDEQRHTQEEKG